MRIHNSSICAILESILFSSGSAISMEQVSKTLDMDKKELEEITEHLIEKFEQKESGIRIIRVNGKYQMCSKYEYSEFIKKFMNIKPDTLSPPSIEVLAIIAYHQPVTKAFVESVRGVNCREIINNLVSKSLIEEKGRLNIPGNPIIYGTTENFLICLGIPSLDMLPIIPNKKETPL